MSLEFNYTISPTSSDQWSKTIHEAVGGVELIGVVGVSSPQAAVVGDATITAIVEGFKSAPSQAWFLTAFSRFSAADVSLGLCLIEGNHLTFYAQGKVNIEILRKTQTNTLLSGGERGRYVAGSMQEGDVYALSVNMKESLKPDDNAAGLDRIIDRVQRYIQANNVLGTALVCFGMPLLAKKEEISKSSLKLPEMTKPSAPIKVTVPQIKINLAKRETKVALVLSLLFLMILGVSLISRSRTNQARAQLLSGYQLRLTTIKDSKEETARQNVESLRLLRDEVLRKKESTSDAILISRLERIVADIDLEINKFEKLTNLGKLSPFYDFRLVASDFSASNLAYDFSGKLLVFLDANRKRILSLSVENKQANVLSLPEELAEVRDITVTNRKALVLANNGIVEISLPLDVLGKLTKAANVWQEPKLARSFGESLYVFDPKVRELLKFENNDVSASPSGWLRNKRGLDFEKVTSLSIDGEVWLGTADGQVLRFRQGEPVTFDMNSLVSPPTGSVVIYADPNTENIYLLSPRDAKIFIFDRNGTHLRTLMSSELQAVTGLVVDESRKQLFILSGSLVFEIAL